MEEKLIATAKTTTNPQLYKEFYKYYYKNATKTLVRITTIIGILAILFAMYAVAARINIYAAAIPAAAGIMLIIYPHFAYVRPYNSVKHNEITTKFEFYEDMMIEIDKSSRDSYEYSQILKAVETGKYYYIYHTKENASVVDKSSIKQHSDVPFDVFIASKLKLTK